MPSGARVDIYVDLYDNETNVDVIVTPLRQDAYHTTGLCGNYSLNPIDYVLREQCTTTCESYRHEILFLLNHHYLNQ